MDNSVCLLYKKSCHSLKRKLAKIGVFPSTTIKTDLAIIVYFSHPWYKFFKVRRIVNDSKRIDYQIYQSSKWSPKI